MTSFAVGVVIFILLLVATYKWGGKRIHLAKKQPLMRPWLIQPCKLREGRFEYSFMYSAEFGWGDQPNSLKRIFSQGVCTGLAKIDVGGKKVDVYLVAAKNFPFADYQPFLQQLVDNELRLKERIAFDTAAKSKAGLETDQHYDASVDIWFDFMNDVLWSLAEDKQKALVSKLSDIKRKWAMEKKKEE